MTGEEELTYKRLMYVCSLYIDNPEEKKVHTVEMCIITDIKGFKAE